MTKSNKRIIIYCAIGLAAMVIIGGIILFGGSHGAQTPAELLSLGEQFLLDLDYENALVQFLKVIEIEPKNERAYLGAVEAYAGLDRTADAIAILEQGLSELPDSISIIAQLEDLRSPPEIEPEAEPETEPESETEPDVEVETRSESEQESEAVAQPETDIAASIPGPQSGQYTVADFANPNEAWQVIIIPKDSEPDFRSLPYNISANETMPATARYSYTDFISSPERKSAYDAAVVRYSEHLAESQFYNGDPFINGGVGKVMFVILYEDLSYAGVYSMVQATTGDSLENPDITVHIPNVNFSGGNQSIYAGDEARSLDEACEYLNMQSWPSRIGL